MTGGISQLWGDISLCLWPISVGVLFYFFKFYVPHKIKTEIEHTSKEKIERLKSSLEKEMIEIKHGLEIEKEKRNRIFGKMHDKRYEFYPEVIDNMQFLMVGFNDFFANYSPKDDKMKLYEFTKKIFYPYIISSYTKALIFCNDSELEIFKKLRSVSNELLIALQKIDDIASYNEFKDEFTKLCINMLELTDELAKEMRKSLFPESK